MVALFSFQQSRQPADFHFASAQAVDFVRKRLARRMTPQAICEAICDHCLAPDTQVTSTFWSPRGTYSVWACCMLSAWVSP